MRGLRIVPSRSNDPSAPVTVFLRGMYFLGGGIISGKRLLAKLPVPWEFRKWPGAPRTAAGYMALAHRM